MKELLLKTIKERFSDSVEAAAMAILFIASPGFALMVVSGSLKIHDQWQIDSLYAVGLILGVGLLAGLAYFSFFLVQAIFNHFRHRLEQAVDQQDTESEVDWQHKVA